jgi:hypothetical protein
MVVSYLIQSCVPCPHFSCIDLSGRPCLHLSASLRGGGKKMATMRPDWMARLASHEGLASIERQPGLPPGVGPLPRPPGDQAR